MAIATASLLDVVLVMVLRTTVLFPAQSMEKKVVTGGVLRLFAFLKMLKVGSGITHWILEYGFFFFCLCVCVCVCMCVVIVIFFFPIQGWHCI